MVRAYHSTFSAYGFWLPNDSRGSWSDFVRSFELYLTGAATKTTETKSLARRWLDRDGRGDLRTIVERSFELMADLSTGTSTGVPGRV